MVERTRIGAQAEFGGIGADEEVSGAAVSPRPGDAAPAAAGLSPDGTVADGVEAGPSPNPRLFVTFITPASWLRRLKPYQIGARVYGTPDSITGPLILAGIVNRAGHHVEAYEELNGTFDYDRLLEKTDVLCLNAMTSTAPRDYEPADLFHQKGHARVIIGGIHPSAVPEEALKHVDQVMEFFNAANRFYDRKSAFRMGQMFGVRDGVSRYVLGMFARLGRAATWLAGVLAPNSWYGRLRSTPWKYEDAAAAAKRKVRSAADACMRVVIPAVMLLVPVGAVGGKLALKRS